MNRPLSLPNRPNRRSEPPRLGRRGRLELLLEIVDDLIDHRTDDGTAVLADAAGFAGDPRHEFGASPKELHIADQLLQLPHPRPVAPTSTPYLGFGPSREGDFIIPTHAAAPSEPIRRPLGAPNPLVGRGLADTMMFPLRLEGRADTEGPVRGPLWSPEARSSLGPRSDRARRPPRPNDGRSPSVAADGRGRRRGPRLPAEGTGEHTAPGAGMTPDPANAEAGGSGVLSRTFGPARPFGGTG